MCFVLNNKVLLVPVKKFMNIKIYVVIIRKASLYYTLILGITKKSLEILSITVSSENSIYALCLVITFLSLKLTFLFSNPTPFCSIICLSNSYLEL